MGATWWERLNDESVSLSVYSRQAKNWNWCAVGEARKQKPGVVVTVDYGIPRDRKLETLGIRFYNAVYANNRPRAKQVYLMIERRLIRMMSESLRDAS